MLAPEYIAADAVGITVEGDGSDLTRLIAQRPDLFSVYLQLKADEQ